MLKIIAKTVLEGDAFKIHIIRYNPDGFKVDGRRKQISEGDLCMLR